MARVDQPSQIVRVVGEQLIAREREQCYQRIDDIRAPRTAEQITRILRIVEHNRSDIDHRQGAS